MKELEREVLSYIDNHTDELYQLLSNLVKIPSINYLSCGKEYLCEKLIMDEYLKLGLKAEKYYPDHVPGLLESPGYLPGRGTHKRPNFCGIYEAANSTKRVMLAAHTDVMPTGDIKQWTVAPFGGIIKDGRIYGRGSNDNKFGIASSIMAFKAIRESGIELESDVVLESYCDEEQGGGNGALGASLKHKCDAIINMDGGNYEIWSCALGGQVLELTATAVEPQDSSLLVTHALLAVQDELKPFIHNRHRELGEDPYYSGTDMERSAFRFYEFLVGDGGLALNLDTGKISFVFYTNKSQEEIKTELDEILGRILVKFEAMDVRTEGFKPLSRFFHYQSLPDDNQTLQLLKTAAEEVAGHQTKISGACLSDLSIFLKYGTPESLSFGILRDFKLYGGAHQHDEFVEQKEFHNHCKAIALFLLRWCGAHKIS